MNIGELIKKKGTEVETVLVNEELSVALEKLNAKHIGALMVLDEKKEVAGIVSERDFLKVCSKCGEKKIVSELMTPIARMFTLTKNDSLQDAMKMFTEKRVRHLPVLESGKLIGIISIGDAVKTLLDAVEQENKYLKEYIMGQDI